MTYSPGTPGFQPSQPSGSYGSPAPSFAKTADAESKLPLYLQIVVAVLGLGVYLANFGPIVTVSNGEYPLILGDAGHTVPLALLAGLLAAVGLLPKAKVYTPVFTAIAALGALLAIATLADAGDDYTVGWGLWLVLTFSVLQAVAAVGELLLEAGVITAPAPRPKFDPYAQYGLPPGGNYYGQSGQQHGYGQQSPQQGGYPSYGGYPSSPSTGGFGAQSGQASSSTGGFNTGGQQAQSAQQGPPTPPTGFPSFGSPSTGGSGSSTTGGQGGTGQTQSSTGGQSSQGGSAPSGPAQP